MMFLQYAIQYHKNVCFEPESCVGILFSKRSVTMHEKLMSNEETTDYSVLKNFFYNEKKNINILKLSRKIFI